MMYPDRIPPLSGILIGAVENWAREQSANAVRINPLENMEKILVNWLGFKRMTNKYVSGQTPYTDEELSPYIENSMGFYWYINLVKFLDDVE